MAIRFYIKANFFMAAHVDDRKFPITKSKIALCVCVCVMSVHSLLSQSSLCVCVRKTAHCSSTHKFYFHRQHKNNLLLYYILCVYGSRVSMNLMVCVLRAFVCFLFTSLEQEKKTFYLLNAAFAWRKKSDHFAKRIGRARCNCGNMHEKKEKNR